MSPVISLCLYRVQEGQDTMELFATDDLSHLGWILRRPVRTVIQNEGHLIAARIRPGQMSVLTYDQPGLSDYLGYAWIHPDGLAAVAFASREYPQQVASKLLREAVGLFPKGAAGEAAANDRELDEKLTRLFQRFQKPDEADKLTKVQKELDEVTKVVMQSMDALLERGRGLEDLAEKSDRLTKSSMDFKRIAERNNSWCVWLQKMLFGKS
mmetsp:Transcript_114159/g.333739  ORF Transcript_114159/g.333739 Transcript_114159/m.333739 type:complete len:211 (+) Transcript_114159:67-699(+)